MEKQELDTSWFDLKKYEGLKDLDLQGWLNQIRVRIWARALNEDSRFSRLIKNTPIVQEICSLDVDAQKYPFNTNSVKSIPAKDIWFHTSVSNSPLNEVWRYCEKDRFKKSLTKEQNDLIEMPLNLLFRQMLPRAFFFNANGCDNYVSVDLTATDEQIMNDFKIWLTEYRKFADYPALQKKDSTKPLKEIGEKEFKQWRENRILPYLDLTIIEKCENKTLRKETLFKLIFPDDKSCLNPEEKLKKTVKPLANWFLSSETISAIKFQLAKEKESKKSQG